MVVCERCNEDKDDVETHVQVRRSGPVPYDYCDDCREELRRLAGEQARAEREFKEVRG